jgi:hypothetical protein
MIVFPEGCDGRGWGRVSGELSKALAFFESTVVSSSSSRAPAGKSLGKVTVFLSFAEVVRLLAPDLVGRPLVQMVVVVWCEMEKLVLLGREQETIWQAVDCFAMERSFG